MTTLGTTDYIGRILSRERELPIDHMKKRWLSYQSKCILKESLIGDGSKNMLVVRPLAIDADLQFFEYPVIIGHDTGPIPLQINRETSTLSINVSAFLRSFNNCELLRIGNFNIIDNGFV